MVPAIDCCVYASLINRLVYLPCRRSHRQAAAAIQTPFYALFSLRLSEKEQEMGVLAKGGGVGGGEIDGNFANGEELISVCLPFCLSACLSVCLSPSLPACLSVCLSLCICMSVSQYLHVSLS